MKANKTLIFSLFFALIFILSACGVNTSALPQELENEAELSVQIVGGTQASPHEFPSMVHLSYGARSSWCGGSLIDAQWVLTAAHCLIGERASDIVVVAGDHRVSTTGDGEQVRKGAKIILHPNYNNNTTNNDIALLKLSSPMTLNSNVQVAKLAGLPTIGTALTVTGWGATREGGRGSDLLLKVSVPYQAATACRSAYPGEITASMFCAGLDEGGKDSCQGDSGGPIFRRLNGQWRQVGIVSWGYGCARPNLYGVYTKAARYTTWINTVMSNN